MDVINDNRDNRDNVSLSCNLKICLYCLYCRKKKELVMKEGLMDVINDNRDNRGSVFCF